MEIKIAVVPVAGLGTRLLPATKSQPKEMLPVGRKPVVQYVVEELAHVGMQRILFITGPGKASIENHFDLDNELIQILRQNGKEDLLAELSFERAPLQYFYTRQRRQLGLGHAVACAQPFVGDQPFAVALGDSIIGLNAHSDVLRTHDPMFFGEEGRGGDCIYRGNAGQGAPLRRRQARRKTVTSSSLKTSSKNRQLMKRPATW